MGLHFKENEEKITLGMIIAGIICIAILSSILIVYLLNINNTNIDKSIEEEQIISRVEEDDDEDEFETVSIDIGKKVEEVENELRNATFDDRATNSVDTETSETSENKVSKNTVETSSNTIKNTEAKKETATTTEKVKEEVKFDAPIKGEIIREFVPDSLVYSETLDEWITHVGVDIKADKTSVIKAAAKGKVEAIKNDPRYGITVIVTHDNGYQTLYANLLTAEYVVEGEEIEEGQTIGTIGNSASFEIADDYHLHFELLKDGEYIDPTNYMSFE